MRTVKTITEVPVLCPNCRGSGRIMLPATNQSIEPGSVIIFESQACTACSGKGQVISTVTKEVIEE